MKHKNLTLFVCLLLICFIFDIISAQDIPEWYLKVPASPDTLFAVGCGDGKAESLLNALSSMCGNIETKIYRYSKKDSSLTTNKVNYSSSVKQVSKQRFGKISINSTTIDAIDSKSDKFQIISILVFEDSNNRFTIKKTATLLSNSNDTHFNFEIEIKSIDCNISDVINELESFGFTFTYYVGDHYFLLARCSKYILIKEP